MKKLLIFLFAIMAFIACTDSGSDDGGGNSNNDQPKVPEITLDATAANFTTEGGSTVVTFTSSDAWTAEAINNRADAWCSVSPTSGTAGNGKVTITATANDTTDDRTATVVIKSGTTQKTIAVSQKQKDALTVTSSKFEISADGGDVAIEVKANIDFEYAIEESAKDWVTYQTTRAMKTSTVVFNVAKSEDVEKREAKITIKSGEFNEVVTIYQEGATPAIILTQNEYSVPSAGETIAVEVNSNVDVTVEIPKDIAWITENTTRGVSTNTYYFDIAPNEEYDARKAEIKFINKENNLSEIISITQAQKDAIVIAEDSYTVSGNGDEIEIEVGHNIEFDITIDGDWITQKQTRTLETTKLTFVVAENTTDEAREGSITFTSKDSIITQVVKVIQQAEVIQAEPIQLYVEVSCDDGALHSYIAQKFGSNVISIKNNDNGYIITLKEGYNEIPEEVFYECRWLEKIIIGNGVTSIGLAAFLHCESLTSITIPDSVTSIGGYAFYGCSSLTDITIGNGVTSIEHAAFWCCSGLTSIIIPDSVTSIGSGAFNQCSSLTSVTIPNSVTSIEGGAFSYCKSLTSITIPDSVISIGYNPFKGCSSLISFNSKFASADNRCLIIEGVLHSFAPAGLTEYTISNSVTSIGGVAFSGCSSLTTITIPDSVTSIGGSAFSNCESLTSITIPDSVTSIGEGAFDNCSSLTSITIPDSVTSIEGYAFTYCGSLTSITIPDSVTSIGDGTFSNCESLTSITIPDSVTDIGDWAFMYCESLTSITIPDRVTSIGDSAFSGCKSLTSITIPDSVTSIGGNAFMYCESLTSVYCKPTTPPTLGIYAFDYNASNRKIYVPTTSVDAYKEATGWSSYADEIKVYYF